jgi:hypothetical protein
MVISFQKVLLVVLGKATICGELLFAISEAKVSA